MSDAKTWALEIDRDWAEMQGDVRDAIQVVALQGVKRLDLMSRVDTGHFRRNWSTTLGAPDATIKQGEDKTGQATVAANRAVIEAYPEDAFPPIYIQNNVEYAIYLEIKDNMVAITTAELAALWEAQEI